MFCCFFFFNQNAAYYLRISDWISDVCSSDLRLIVEGAVQFFAEVGFGGDTRELAKRLNITHPLLFRYFASKNALIERVYQEVFIGRWNPYWEIVISNRNVPLRERLVNVYQALAQT